MFKSGFGERSNVPKYVGPPTVFIETSEDDFNQFFHDKLWRDKFAKGTSGIKGKNTQETTIDSISDLFNMGFPNSTLSNSFRK